MGEEKLRKALLKVLDETNCSKCDHDEAEGEVLDHCDKCCRSITTQVWAIVVNKEARP